MAKLPLIAPSILAADFLRLGEEVRGEAGAGAIVAGSSIFHTADYAAAIAALREAGGGAP